MRATSIFAVVFALIAAVAVQAAPAPAAGDVVANALRPCSCKWACTNPTSDRCMDCYANCGIAN
ncbi:hypothetical protein H9P43_000461 [Blastocladiella emersonii ATCC 22665]|nr:hypothetical protein H9P43_000461 [Blastocladiella emersonii ATCC 22665]